MACIAIMVGSAANSMETTVQKPRAFQLGVIWKVRMVSHSPVMNRVSAMAHQWICLAIQGCSATRPISPEPMK